MMGLSCASETLSVPYKTATIKNTDILKSIKIFSFVCRPPMQQYQDLKLNAL
jgi:hypothetical protein